MSVSLLIAAILGVVEGLTEFLPISSTGHLILAAGYFALPPTEFQKTFEIAIQLGAILAVVFLYAKRLLRDRRTVMLVVTGFIPTALIGFLLHDFVKSVLLGSVATVLWSLFVGGIVIVLFEVLHRERKSDAADLTRVSFAQAVLIGLFQSIALIPGVSRAAATILGGELIGLRRTTATEFSFLLAIPTMAAAAGLDLVKSAGSFTSGDVVTLGVGFIVSFLTALAVIRWLLRFIQHHSFVLFGVYRIVLAAIVATWLHL